MKVTLAPGLVLTDEMYELARAALEEVAPDQVKTFTWQRAATPKNWLRIPDTEYPEKYADGYPWFKAEMKILHGPPYHRTIKLNLWRAADLRRRGEPIPHNHPWPFFSKLLMGGYKENRWLVELNQNKIIVDPYQRWEIGTALPEPAHVWQAGEINDIPLSTFHEVTEILEPGRTLSLMVCDLGRKDGWGHLEEVGGRLFYVPNKLGEINSKHKMMLHELNPHLASK